MSSPDVYESLSRVHRPQQDRSRQAQFAALDAFETMLRDRPLHKVTVQEVADRAKLSITSVYARFDGKKALVLALHERVSQEALQQLADLLAEAAAADDPLDRTISMLMTSVVRFADDNKHVFGAVLSADDEETNERAAAFIRSGSEAVAAHVLPRLGRPHDEADRDIDFAWRTAMAIQQQSWALGAANPARHPMGPDELAERMAAQFLNAIGYSD